MNKRVSTQGPMICEAITIPKLEMTCDLSCNQNMQPLPQPNAIPFLALLLFHSILLWPSFG